MAEHPGDRSAYGERRHDVHCHEHDCHPFPHGAVSLGSRTWIAVAVLKTPRYPVGQFLHIPVYGLCKSGVELG
jgi:hypothetical protein